MKSHFQKEKKTKYDQKNNISKVFFLFQLIVIKCLM